MEAWWFRGLTDDAQAGWFIGMEIGAGAVDYWAGLVRVGEPYLYLEELATTALRSGLEIKPPEMWAGFTCDDPYRQWSMGNEAHAVLLDDPLEAWTRAYGEKVPVTFDVEWYATSDPVPLVLGDDRAGYEQAGEFDAVIELREGVLHLTGSAHRLHRWGADRPDAMPERTDAPLRRRDGSPSGVRLGVHNGSNGLRT
jgi:hypothetical protein